MTRWASRSVQTVSGLICYREEPKKTEPFRRFSSSSDHLVNFQVPGLTFRGKRVRSERTRTVTTRCYTRPTRVISLSQVRTRVWKCDEVRMLAVSRLTSKPPRAPSSRSPWTSRDSSSERAAFFSRCDNGARDEVMVSPWDRPAAGSTPPRLHPHRYSDYFPQEKRRVIDGASLMTDIGKRESVVVPRGHNFVYVTGGSR